MDILDAITTQPAQNSPQARAAQIAAEIINGVPSLVVQFIQQRNNFFNKFWNTQGVPPQLNAAAMGNKAVSTFARDAALVAFFTVQLKSLTVPMTDAQIAALLPGVPAIYTATPNADGTVTIVLAPIPAQ